MTNKRSVACMAAGASLALTTLMATAEPAYAADTQFGDLASCAYTDRVQGELSMGLAFGAAHVSYDACIKNRKAMGPYIREVTAVGDPSPRLDGFTGIPLAYDASVEPGSWRGQNSSSATYDFAYVQRVVAIKRWGIFAPRYDMDLTIQADKVELCITEPMGRQCETSSLIGR